MSNIQTVLLLSFSQQNVFKIVSKAFFELKITSAVFLIAGIHSKANSKNSQPS